MSLALAILKDPKKLSKAVAAAAAVVMSARYVLQGAADLLGMIEELLRKALLFL